MSQEDTNKAFDKQDELSLNNRDITNIYLLDGNIVDIFEYVLNHTRVDLFEEIEKQEGYTFMFTSGVAAELMNRPGSIDMNIIKHHIINTSGSSSSKKENRFIIEEDGESRVAFGNMVSIVDWEMVLLCQENKRLMLVTNDYGLTKNALRAIGENRTKTIYSLLNELSENQSNDGPVKKAIKCLGAMKKLKIRKGEDILWMKPPPGNNKNS